MKRFRLSLFSGSGIRLDEDVITAEDKKEAIAIALSSMKAEKGLYDKKRFKWISINWKGAGMCQLNDNEELDIGDLEYYYSTGVGARLSIRVSEML